MKRFGIIIVCCCIILLSFCGCNTTMTSTNTTTPDTQPSPRYYTLADFAGIVRGKTTYSEVIKLVPPPEHTNVFEKVFKDPLVYPAKDDCEITVCFDEHTGVVTKISFTKTYIIY